MNRLTKQGFVFDSHYVASNLQSYPIAQALNRLAAYEDTDKTPAQISEQQAEVERYKARLTELEKPSKEMDKAIEYGLEERYGTDRSMWP